MQRQSTRRTVLRNVAAGEAAVRLGTHGGRMFAATSESSQNSDDEGTPVTGSNQEEVEMTAETNKELWGPWLELWNGALAVADEIIAPGFVAHFAPAGNSPSEVRGPEGLKAWIGGTLAAFTDYGFATTVGPLADDDKVAGRWVFRGTYQGGIPGSSPTAVGQLVEYEGADIFRVEDGKLVEYWLSADILQLLQQIGVIPS